MQSEAKLNHHLVTERKWTLCLLDEINDAIGNPIKWCDPINSLGDCIDPLVLAEVEAIERIEACIALDRD